MVQVQMKMVEMAEIKDGRNSAKNYGGGDGEVSLNFCHCSTFISSFFFTLSSLSELHISFNTVPILISSRVKAQIGYSLALCLMKSFTSSDETSHLL